jgi:MFS family permease
VYGFCLGIGVSLASIYITECSPPHLRGTVGAFIGLFGWFMLSVTTSLCLPQMLGTTARWAYIPCIHMCLCAVSMVIAAVYLPETPKYLFLKQRKVAQARSTITRLYGPDTNVDEVLAIFTEEQQQAPESAMTLRELWRTPHLRQGLLVGCAGALARAFCGVNILYAFSTSLITTAFPLEPITAKYIAFCLLLPQLIGSLITICIIDRVGRRKLFLTSLGVMTASNTLFIALFSVYEHGGVSSRWVLYIALVALMIACWVFPVGITPIGFILVSEVTPQAARSKSVSVAMSCLNLGFLVQYVSFPILQASISGLSIGVLTVLPSTLLWLWLYRHMPETRGRPVEDIVKKWMRNVPRTANEEDRTLVGKSVVV